ncbi:mucin-5AC [Lucilia cuprina]|uniref:mucin-5AC n=1 Tax=Lucilia cuprina TaxID=7375 RepID=UPI001F06F425|nr:mucin-5AC [Lucilia cuprina]
MSSSIVTANTTAPVSAMATAATNLIASLPGSRQQPPTQQPTPTVAGAIMPAMNAQFREIHKNTWLKRLTAEGKKVCVGPKKSERSWVVFCVHDDTEALLEGYAEPRQAPSHNPEWIVSMQDTLHISHALIPNSHEFEFVVTLSNEVVRFHAMSWDIMQEWVETLRSKLREMKILSPRENLYTKLPEVRAPLLPTRDPTSPLPAPPPVPAAIVPGVERVIPPSVQQQQSTTALETNETRNSLNNTGTTSPITSETSMETITTTQSTFSTAANTTTTQASLSSTTTSNMTAAVPNLTSMSNTLTQNLLNMLSDPISAYSEQLNDANSSSSSIEPDEMVTGSSSLSLAMERDFNLSDCSTEEEFIGPLLRKPSANNSDINGSFTNNSVRLDVLAAHRASADQIRNMENILQCERYIPRPQTSRSLSAGAVDKSKRQNINQKVEANSKLSSLMVANTSSKGNNITELEVNSENSTPSTTSSDNSTNTNITIIQVSTENRNDKTTATSASGENNYEPPKLPHKTTTSTAATADVFKFPDAHVSVTKNIKHHEYKSNVQIIPSSSNKSNSSTSSSSSNSNLNNSSTIQVMGNSTTMVGGNQYTTPVKKTPAAASVASTIIDEHSKITTVHVAGTDNTYGTCFTPPSSSSASTSHTSTPKMPKKIILSANTSGITNITVNNTTTSEEMSAVVLRKNSIGGKLENEFAISSANSNSANLNKNNGLHYEKVFLSSTATISTTDAFGSVQPTSSTSQNITPLSPKWSSPLHRHSKQRNKEEITASPLGKSLANTNGVDKKVKLQNATTKQHSGEQRHKSPTQMPLHTADQPMSSINMGSPVMARRRFVSPSNSRPIQTAAPRPPFILTRGLTEAVITSRPSRKDFHFLNKLSVAKTKSSNTNSNSNKSSNTTNNNENGSGSSASTTTTPSHLAVNRTTSEALEQRRRSSSTSDAQSQRHTRGTNNNDPSNRANIGSSGGGPLRQPPQPFRLAENILGVSSSPGNTTSPAKRMTLREQQVMQLRREIMHPGGVRLQLRRKDCVGSIAWVDAFGAVWVAGWKQKEHPVLYNALHIGDQLLSIAGVTISSATEANKIIRNTNTLFVEVLVRRIPFGRGYAIRREREGQCLGLIRDGNTSTIVDVVPNSLAARHGLPPKAQSCDGTTLTFWVLTEINGRPLNLFFKDNEIRDRLNSVGRDISILVQPSDLITKLKKQLKSLRGYKDYLVQ